MFAWKSELIKIWACTRWFSKINSLQEAWVTGALYRKSSVAGAIHVSWIFHTCLGQSLHYMPDEMLWSVFQVLWNVTIVSFYN